MMVGMDLALIEDAGRGAWHQGRQVATCPYAVTSDEGKAWVRGWNAAAMSRRDVQHANHIAALDEARRAGTLPTRTAKQAECGALMREVADAVASCLNQPLPIHGPPRPGPEIIFTGPSGPLDLSKFVREYLLDVRLARPSKFTGMT